MAVRKNILGQIKPLWFLLAFMMGLLYVHIATPAGQFADRVQELHIKVIHILIESIERDLAPQNYK
jgi:D-sedoheptulose 7-phosphate isomerase